MTVRRRTVLLAGIGVGVVAVAGVSVAAVTGASQPAPTTASASPTPRPVAPTPTPRALPDVPPAPDGATLAALPLAFYDAVIPQLLDGASAKPRNRWEIATPKGPLVALYASPDVDAEPVATLGQTVPTIETPTATAVWGRSAGQDGGMVLVSTPSRNRTPGTDGAETAPSATFAWARAADFTIAEAEHEIRVDNATSVVSVVDRDGGVTATETARLGTPDDPTPADTMTYMEANYVDTRIAYTQGNPIALTGAHSSRLAGYGGNSALTALHYYPDPTGSSHGCVRVSAAMTAAFAALPVGTPITFS